MKKLIALVIGLLLALSIVSAQEAEKGQMAIGRPDIMPPTPGPDTGTFGQNHYYAVTFDEEGEAAVAMRMEFQNINKKPLSTITLEIPGSVRMINAFQEVQEKRQRCSSWTVAVPFASDTAAEDVPKEYSDKCTSWYDYYETRYYGVDVKENKLSKSSEYTFTLDRKVEAQNTGALILYYKAQGYSTKSFGAFDFDFETAKINQDVNSVRVSVNVLEGLTLKGVEGNIEYRQNMMMEKSMAAPMAAGGVASPDLQNFAQQIKWANGLTKTAQGLDPLESFHVTGTYARSKFALYGKALSITTLIIVLALIGLVWGIRKIFSAVKAKPGSASGKMTAALTGIVSAVVLFLIWVVGVLLIRFVGQSMDYQVQGLVILLVVILAIILSIVLFVLPSLLIGWKYGMLEGLMCFGIFIGTLVILAIFVVVALAILGTSMSSYSSGVVY